VIDKPIHLVLGGTHLLPATPEEISRIATALRDEWQVAWLAPAHCTGESAFAILEESFGDRYLYAGLGTTLELGPKVTIKAEAGQPPIHAMDVEDVVSYRVALARRMRDALAGGACVSPIGSHSACEGLSRVRVAPRKRGRASGALRPSAEPDQDAGPNIRFGR
jgi:hypothetical protein